MKKLISIILIFTLSVLFFGCADSLTQNGKTYYSFGIVNEDAYRSDDVVYQVCFGNVFWSIVLIETVIFPIYVIGWSLWKPVRLKGNL